MADTSRNKKSRSRIVWTCGGPIVPLVRKDSVGSNPTSGVINLPVEGGALLPPAALRRVFRAEALSRAAGLATLAGGLLGLTQALEDAGYLVAYEPREVEGQ